MIPLCIAVLLDRFVSHSSAYEALMADFLVHAILLTVSERGLGSKGKQTLIIGGKAFPTASRYDKQATRMDDAGRHMIEMQNNEVNGTPERIGVARRCVTARCRVLDFLHPEKNLSSSRRRPFSSTQWGVPELYCSIV